MSLWRYAEHLPVLDPVHRISLGEGQTPLVSSHRIGPRAGLSGLFFKLDNCNPTGSFKDRFAVMAASVMRSRGQTLCLATSSGNTGSALSAACAVAGLACYIAVVDGAPLNKLRNMQVYGARIYTVRGFGRDPVVSAAVMNRLQQLCQEEPRAALQISCYALAPIGMAGCETIAHELAEQLEGRVDHVFTQAGGGGMTLAVARGFQVLKGLGRIASLPATHCVQPVGNDTIATPLRAGANQGREVTCTTTVSGLQVPNVLDAEEVIRACRAVGGNGHAVTDEEVFEAQRRLAREEGIFTEPAGATALAGVLSAARRGELRPGDRIVCTITGTGFKDEKSLGAMVSEATCPCLEGPEAIRDFVGQSP